MSFDNEVQSEVPVPVLDSSQRQQQQQQQQQQRETSADQRQQQEQSPSDAAVAAANSVNVANARSVSQDTAGIVEGSDKMELNMSDKDNGAATDSEVEGTNKQAKTSSVGSNNEASDKPLSKLSDIPVVPSDEKESENKCGDDDGLKNHSLKRAVTNDEEASSSQKNDEKSKKSLEAKSTSQTNDYLDKSTTTTTPLNANENDTTTNTEQQTGPNNNDSPNQRQSSTSTSSDVSNPQEAKGESSKISTSTLTSTQEKQNDIHPDRQRTLLLLAHRKMILHRLKQCRKAAEERLIEYQKTDERQANKNNARDNVVQENMSKQVSSGAPKLPLKSNHQVTQIIQPQQVYYKQRIYGTQQEEMRAYKELSSFALSFNNRRQAAPPTQLSSGVSSGLNRTISLRTGSTVGNKMKAAVASLTNTTTNRDSNANSPVEIMEDTMIDGNNVGGSIIQQQGKKILMGQKNKDINTTIGNSNATTLVQQNIRGNNQIQIINNIQRPISSNSASASMKKDDGMKKGSSVTMSNNMSIINGPDTVRPQLVQSTSQMSSTGKKLKKKTKGKRSSSKKSASVNATSTASNPSNDSGVNQVEKNIPLHHSVTNNGDTSSDQRLNNPGDQSMKNIYQHTLQQGIVKGLHPQQNFCDSHGRIVQRNIPGRILCPETERLRKKRKLIETKLQTIFKKRYMQFVVEESQSNHNFSLNWAKESGKIQSKRPGVNIVASPTSSTCDPTGQRSLSSDQQRSTFQYPLSCATPNENPYIKSQNNSKQKDRRSPLTWKTYMNLGGYSATSFPQRRKTQWDYVLEEMRWMATDFIEERKWKKACTRTLSHYISTNKSRFVSSPSRRLPSSSRISTSSKGASTSSASFSGSSETKKDNSKNNHVKLVKIEREANRNGSNGDVVENSDEESMVEEDASKLNNRSVQEIRYEHPSDSDLKETKHVAKVLTTIILDQWKYMPVEFDNSVSRPDQLAAFSRYLQLKDRLNEQDDISNNEAKAMRCENNDPKAIGERRQFSFEEIISEMERSLMFALKLPIALKSTYVKYERNLSSGLGIIGLELHVSQIKCLQFAEALWSTQRKSSGFILSGPVASGKSFSVCALLWRRREDGPQLLICSSASLVRWRHELKRFTGLNVHTIGIEGWSFDATSYNGILNHKMYGPSDVLLCDSSHVTTLNRNTLSANLTCPFTTIAVDTRGAQVSGSNSIQDFESPFWWGHIIKDLVLDVTKTILISSTMSTSCEHTINASISPLKDKKDVELLSLKLAFIQHHLFNSKNALYGKRAFRWAKRQYNLIKNLSVLENAKHVFRHCIGGKGVISKSVEILTHIHEEVDEDLPSVFPSWFVQFCPLSGNQRNAYERVCSFLRGSLVGSHDVSAIDSFLSFAKAMLRLRRVCFHSNLHKYVGDHNAVEEISQHEADWDCSQPNFELAQDFLVHSSKLQQLLNILHKDCGCEIAESDKLLTVTPRNTRKRRKRKKVLILSSLPDILRITSLFLNAVGISHELVLPAAKYDAMQPIQTSSCTSSSLNWLHCQQTIARFEMGSASGTTYDIILSSPEVLGSSSLGLSASNAEVVISLDEDWSGRSNLLYYSILMKNCVQADSGDGRKYIKLIAEDTCEESFLTFAKKVKGGSSVYPIPLSKSSINNSMIDSKGYLLVASENDSTGSLLGSNILRCSNVPLSKVLCTESSFPPFATIGCDLRFLADDPYYQEDDCQISQVKFDTDLINLGTQVPSLLDDQLDQFSPINSENGKKKSMSLAKSLIDAEAQSVLNSYCGVRYNSKGYEELFKNTSDITSRDTISKQVQGYLFLFKKNTHSYGSSQREVLKVSSKSLTNNSSKSRRERGKRYKDKAKARSVHPVRKNIVTTETLLSSFLFYEGEDKGKDRDYSNREENNLKRTKAEYEEEECNKKMQKNLCATSFSMLRSQLDGNQGTEPIIYFPPLFPHLHEAVLNRTKNDVSEITQETIPSKKRKLIVQQERTVSGKNPRVSQTIVSPGKNTSLSNSLQNEAKIPIPKDIISELNLSDADFINNTDSFFDDDFLPGLSLDKEAEAIDDKTFSISELNPGKQEINEDFGLLGTGSLVSYFDESMQYGKALSVSSNSYSFWLDPFEPNKSASKVFSNCYEDEHVSMSNGPQLDSLVLRVKRKQSSMQLPRFFSHKFNRPLHRPGLSNNISYPMKNELHVAGQNAQKKQKKNHSLSPAHPDMARSVNVAGAVASIGPHSNHGLAGRTSIMQDRGISSISPSKSHNFKAYLLVQSNLVKCFHSSMKSDHMGKDDAQSIFIKSLRDNEHTGDMDIVTATSQRDHFVDDQSNIVNFVPFSIGFLTEKERKKAGTVGSRIGIKLPMGVKVTNRFREFSRVPDTDWNNDDDSLLNSIVSKFGSNWHVACQVLSSNSGDVKVGLEKNRSARQCYERWKSINPQSHLIQDDKSFGQIDQKGNEVVKKMDLTNIGNIIVDFSVDKNQIEPLRNQKSVKSRFQRLNKATSKQHIIPLIVPGYNSSNSNQSIHSHPSHPSHIQSVRDAVSEATGSHDVKLEMWPIQFLDIAEIRRKNLHQRSSGSSRSPQKHPPYHQHSKSQQVHRQPSGSNHQQPPVPQHAPGRNQSSVQTHPNGSRVQENTQPTQPIFKNR